MIVDSLLYYSPTTREATVAEILADLAPLGLANEESLDTSRAMFVSLIVAPATYDEEGNQISPEQTLPGLAVWVSLSEVSDDLWELPGDVCRLQANRDAWAARQPDWLIRTRVAPDMLANIIVSPSFAGADYPFGSVAT